MHVQTKELLKYHPEWMHSWHQASGILQLASKNPSCWPTEIHSRGKIRTFTVSGKIYSLFFISLNWWLRKSFLLFSGDLKLESLFTCCSSINTQFINTLPWEFSPLFLHSSFNYCISNPCTVEKRWGLCRLDVAQGQAGFHLPLKKQTTPTNELAPNVYSSGRICLMKGYNMKYALFKLPFLIKLAESTWNLLYQPI